MSGGKPVRKKKRNTASTRVAGALRMAALSLRNSETALGAYYRKIARRIGGDVAVFATARKLATLIYRLLRWGQQYVDEGAEAFEKRYQEIRIRSLKAKAKELGYELIQSAGDRQRADGWSLRSIRSLTPGAVIGDPSLPTAPLAVPLTLSDECHRENNIIPKGRLSSLSLVTQTGRGAEDL